MLLTVYHLLLELLYNRLGEWIVLCIICVLTLVCRLPRIVASGEGDELEIELSQEMISLGKLNLPIYITVSQVVNLVSSIFTLMSSSDCRWATCV